MIAPAMLASHGGDGDRETPSPQVRAALAQRPDLAALEAQLYGHVLDCIDFDALYGLEQLLWHLVDKLGLGHLDLDDGLSKWMIRRALVRAAHDPSTTFTDVPFGITKQEAKAARFDPECAFCRYEDEHPREKESEHRHTGDDCPLCDDLAREWREKHADALRRRGLRCDKPGAAKCCRSARGRCRAVSSTEDRCTVEVSRIVDTRL